jgi:RNA polymerase sigma factor (sigma-70 family)
MNSQVYQKLITHAETLLAPQASDSLSNAELLRRFLKDQDQVAFAAIVRRHGPLVWSVCRQLAANEADAEDAYQACFLALLKSAKTIRNPQALGSWLHRVANRICKNSLRSLSRRRKHERAANRSEATRPIAPSTWESWHAIVHEEIDRLPDRYRIPFVLCILQGNPQPEAAIQLRWKPGTLSGRLSKAKQALLQALEKRDLKGTTLATAIAGGGIASAPLSAHLVEKCLTLLPASSAVIAPSIGQLAQEATRHGLLSTKAMAFSLVVTVSLMAAGTSYFATAQSQSPTPPTSPPKVEAKAEVVQNVDIYGDPLPEGAIGRLGTIQHRAADANFAITTDGKTMVTAGNDLVVRKFDAESGMLLHTFPLANVVARESVLSEDGRYLASILSAEKGNSPLCIWDLESGNKVDQLQLDGPGIRLLAIHSPTMQVCYLEDNEKLVIRQFIKIASTQLKHRVAKGRPNGPKALFSPDGSILLYLSRSTLTCYEISTGKILWEMESVNKNFAFDSKGEHVLVNSSYYAMERFNTMSGKKEGAILDFDRKDSSGYICVNPQGDRLAIRTDTGLVVYDLIKKSVIREVADPTLGPTFQTSKTKLLFDREGKNVFWRQSSLQKWDISTGKVLWPIEEGGHADSVSRIQFSPNGSTLASISSDTFSTNTILFAWNMTTLTPRRKVIARDRWAFAATNNDLMVSDNKGRLSLIDFQNGNSRLPFNLIDIDFTNVACRNRFAVAIEGVSRRNTDDWRHITVWDAKSGAVINQFKLAKPSEQTTLSEDGQFAAVFDPYAANLGVRIVPTICLGDEKIVQLPDRFVREVFLLNNMTFSPASRYLATRIRYRAVKDIFEISDDNPIRIWERSTGREVTNFAGKGVLQCTFSPDERFFMMSDSDGIRGIELASKQEAYRIPCPSKASSKKLDHMAQSLALSPNGRTIAYGQRDGTILLFDAGGNVSPLTAATLPQALDALSGEDAKAAFQAICQLSSQPELVIPALRERAKAKATNVVAGRIVQVLEMNATPSSRELLNELSKDETKGAISQEAKRALGRLHDR